jgi:tRNA-specific 2-thiouridylase
MSGGVDSSVVAGMLVRDGYDVIGITMQIWQESQTDPRHAGCCSLGAVEDARGVARRLGFPYYVINFKEEFKQSVIDNFVDEYERGRTPNPCIQCNRHVKFDALLEKAKEVGCDKLATGHYARVGVTDDGFRLLRAKSKDKDQSYALYSLSQEQLARVMFPLGELEGKHETRELARDMGLPLADKPDSQEICFVSEAGGYREFLKKKRPSMFRRGEIVSQEGKVLGEHGGVATYTVGQRRGLRLNVDGKPLFVLRIEPQTNRVVVGDDEDLFVREVLFDDELGYLSRPTRAAGKIRYNMPAATADVHPGTPSQAIFDSPVRAVTPGQAAVFYNGDEVVAGGLIRRQSSTDDTLQR